MPGPSPSALARHCADGPEQAAPRPEPLADLARLAAAVCDAPFAAVILTGTDGVTVASSYGDHACARIDLHRVVGALVAPGGVTIAIPPDGPAYAGAAIVAGGRPVGTIAVLGFAPAALSEARRGALSALARQAGAQLELEAEVSELRDLAFTDPLTGVGNRRRLDEALGRMLARTDSGGLLGVIFCDIDDFKPVNDRFGHHAGDRLLGSFARQLSAMAGRDGVVTRIAGDEFVVVCPNLPDPAALESLARRIRAASCPPPHPASRPARISAGTALAQPGDRPEDLLRRADAAMYADKARKRTLRDETRRIASARRLRGAGLRHLT